VKQVAVDLDAVIFAVTDDEPRVLTVTAPDRPPALPSGPLDPGADRTLELGLRGWVREQTGLELGYVEQLYTFGDRDRHAGTRRSDVRVISVAYLALVREQLAGAGARSHWQPVYACLPWEDRRAGRASLLEQTLLPGLHSWSVRRPTLRQARRERIEIAFGLGNAGWDEERVLDRCELLYEAGLLPEALQERDAGPLPHGLGDEMALDHRRILATALGRLRAKLKYRPVVFELLPEVFTLLQLQRVVETLAGGRLHKQNFRRLVERAGLVEGTGRQDTHTGGRPAELFRFRREVLRERPAPGVGLPGLPDSIP
jgi:hypothetical protein